MSSSAPSSSSAASTAPSQQPNTLPLTLGNDEIDLIDEDDEFEEFDRQDWDPAAVTPEDGLLWSDSWDDDEIDDKFVNQLREQIALHKGKTSGTSSSPAPASSS